MNDSVVERCFAAGAPLFLIAGPCAIESRQLATDTAGVLRDLCAAHGVPFIFKASYDKANRTSTAGKRGVGLDKGLEILADIGNTLNVATTTDVHLPQDAAAVAAAVDVLQIPAFLSRQTDLIAACAATGQALNIKKGQFLAPQDMLHVADKARAAGCRRLMLCERGASFGYHNLVADMRSLVLMRAAGCPVVFDATHSVQLPGGGDGQSSGMREMVPPLARAACAVGVAGLFIEAHPTPQQAVSDAATQWRLRDMPALLESLLAINTVARAGGALN